MAQAQNSVSRGNKQAQTESILGKGMPHSPEAEKAVLGALLLNDEYVSQVIELILPSDFYSIAHKCVYEAIVSLTEQRKRVDIITLQDELSKRGTLQDVGGVVYLMSLQEDIPSVGLIQQHAEIIKEKSVLRDLISSATEIITKCYNQNNSEITAVLDDAEKTIFSIANKRTQQSFVQLNIWLKKTFQQLSNIKSNAKGITGISTGYKKLDEMTSGFQKGDLIVLAGRPSMGKTGLALNIAAQAGMTNAAVGIFSLEMAAEQLTLRMLSSESGIAHHNIRNASITSDEWVQLTNVAAQLGNTRLYIDDSAMVNVMELRTKARKLKAQGNLDFIVVDYLQLLSGAGKFENRHQEVSAISRGLKALAKELEVPVLALSQLSRAVDSRMDKRPMLSDLRESGAIEQDADVIMFLYRDVVYNQDTEQPNIAELIIGKQRNGPTGTVYLNFVRELTKFEDAEYD